ncbi:MAG: TonB-dependent receptor [Myxococcales bacterium]
MSRSALSLIVLLLALLGLSGTARGEPAPTAPVAEGSTDIPYPDGASGDTEVLLELVVEPDGAVSRVIVIEGGEPFAGVAREAASGWRFTPALRAGAPVRARIRARVAFHQELPHDAPNAGAPPPIGTGPVAAAATRSATPVALRPTGAPEVPLDVTVRGRRRDVGQTTLSYPEVRAVPGAFGDSFRAIEALPGVTPLVSGLPYFFVRGAPPNDNGYYVDGIRVPLLFHIGIGQGVIHPGLIDHVDFFPGAAPAAHGGFAGAIIAGQTRDPAPAPRGEANLRLVDAGALVESPVAGNRGSVLLAGRYGYPGPILGAISSGLDVSYWDYQTRATWRLTDRDTLGVFAFGSHDYLATPSPSSDPTARPIEQFVSDFHRVDLRYDHALSDGRVRLALTGGHDRQGAAPTYITDNSAGLRLEMEGRASEALRIRGGLSAELAAYGFTQNPTGPNDPPVPSTANPPPTNLTASAHADVIWHIGSRVELTPGARFDLFASSRAEAPGATTRARTTVPTFDPRLSARVAVTPSIAWLSTAGIAHQYPALRVGGLPSPLLTVPGFPPGLRQVQTALQASEGLEIGLPADVVLTATGFLSRWSGLTDLTAACVEVNGGASSQVPTWVCPDTRPITGHAYGLELLVRRSLSKRLGGWLSYTLSRSIRDARFVTPAGGSDLATVPSDADRRHVLNAVVAYQLGAHWRLGGRGLFYTGTPYSQLEGTLPVPPYNAYRTPSFFRLDVRLERRWSLGKTGSIALVIEGQNVTLSRETSGAFLDCRDEPGVATQCTHGKVGPITLPSVGVEAFF